MEYIPIFYTKREQEALFVEDKTGGLAGSINASSYGLVSSLGINSVSWNKRNLVSGSEVVLGWEGGLGFYGSTPIPRPSGSNLVNSITSLGLANYTVTTGNNFVNLIFNSTGITYQPTSLSQNIAQQIVSCGIVTPFIQPSGSSLVNLISQAGLFQYTLSTPTGSNLYTSLSSINLFPITQVTGNNIFDAGAAIVGGEKPQYSNAYGAAVRMGFLNDTSTQWWTQNNTSLAPLVTTGNAISILLNYPNIVPTQNANTLGIFPWSDATYVTTVSVYFGNVSCSGGSVTRGISFGGTISSSIVTWWNPASFNASIGGGPGVVSPDLFVASNQITFGNQIGGFAFLGLPESNAITEPALGKISPALIFRIINATNTGAVIQCINPYRETINQTTASFRIVAF